MTPASRVPDWVWWALAGLVVFTLGQATVWVWGPACIAFAFLGGVAAGGCWVLAFIAWMLERK